MDNLRPGIGDVKEPEEKPAGIDGRHPPQLPSVPMGGRIDPMAGMIIVL